MLGRLQARNALRTQKIQHFYINRSLPTSGWGNFTHRAPDIEATLAANGNRPLLSVCISTYNRAKWLDLNLSHLSSFIGKFGSQIELVVVDNASEDDTSEVVARQSRVLDIKYFRNDSNVGMLGNLKVTAERATGKYTWIIGDDDLIQESGIKETLSAISVYPNLEFIYLNYAYTHLELNDGVRPKDVINSQVAIAETSPSRYSSTLSEIAANTENFFTAIYACVFRTDHARLCFSQDTSGEPFSSLLTCVPTTNYVLENLLDRPAYWVGSPAIVINMNVSWLRYADLWVLERFPEMYSRFENAGVSSSQINFYRNRSKSGVLHHLRDSLVRTDSNFQRIDLSNLLTSYKKVEDYEKFVSDVVEILSEFGHDLPSELHPSNPLTINISGPFIGTYSLASINRKLLKALSQLGHDTTISLSPTEDQNIDVHQYDLDNETLDAYKPADVPTRARISIRNTFPPTSDGMESKVNSFHSFGWEESELPTEYVDELNKLDGITVMSNFVRDALISSGVQVPIYTTGVGLDIHTTKNRFSNRANFVFLHISSCFPRKGVDVLISAYLQAFTSEDEVELVIKTFPNQHNMTEAQIRFESAKHTKPAKITLINEDWPGEEELNNLYETSDVLVFPSRGEGFALPPAEALMLGIPVITTGFGGQLDYLGFDYPWLIDYEFEKSASHVTSGHSYWASPNLNHLVELLREAKNSSQDYRDSIASLWAKRITDRFSWEQVALNNIRALEKIESKIESKPQAFKIGLISTWQTACGIAEHSRNLVSGFSKQAEFIIFGNNDAGEINSSRQQANVIRNWTVGENVLAIDASEYDQLDAVIVQYQPSFFSIETLIQFIGEHPSKPIFVILHNVEHFTNNLVESSRIKLLSCNVTFLVHSINDMNLIKKRDELLITKTKHVPHGLNEPILAGDKVDDGQIRIALFGFVFPHKGFEEFLRCCPKILSDVPNVKITFNTALADGVPSDYLEYLKKLAYQLGVAESIIWNTEFVSKEVVLTRLSRADLVVMPYLDSTESASGALRDALSSGTEILTSKSKIFDEIADVVYSANILNETEFAEAVVSLITKKVKPNPRSDRRADFVARYSWGRISQRVESIVKSKLEG